MYAVVQIGSKLRRSASGTNFKVFCCAAAGTVSRLLPASADTNHNAANALRVFADITPSPLHASLVADARPSIARSQENRMLKGLCRGHQTQFPRKMPMACPLQGRP